MMSQGLGSFSSEVLQEKRLGQGRIKKKQSKTKQKNYLVCTYRGQRPDCSRKGLKKLFKWVVDRGHFQRERG